MKRSLIITIVVIVVLAVAFVFVNNAILSWR